MREVERQAPLRQAHPTPPAQSLLQAALGLPHPLRAVTKRVNYPTGLKEKLKIPHAPGPGQRALRRPPHSLPPRRHFRRPSATEATAPKRRGGGGEAGKTPRVLLTPFVSLLFLSLLVPPRPARRLLAAPAAPLSSRSAMAAPGRLRHPARAQRLRAGLARPPLGAEGGAGGAAPGGAGRNKK